MGNLCCKNLEELNINYNCKFKYKCLNIWLCNFSFIYNLFVIKNNNDVNSFLNKLLIFKDLLFLVINRKIDDNIKEYVENNNIFSLNIDNFMKMDNKQIKTLKSFFNNKKWVILDFEIIYDSNYFQFLKLNEHYKFIFDKFIENKIKIDKFFIFYDKNKNKKIINLLKMNFLNFTIPYYLFNSEDSNINLKNSLKIYITNHENLNKTLFSKNFQITDFIFINKQKLINENNCYYINSNYKINIYEIIINSENNVWLIINNLDFLFILKILPKIINMMFQVDLNIIKKYLNSLFDLNLKKISNINIINNIENFKNKINSKIPLNIVKKLLKNIINNKFNEKYRIIKKNNKFLKENLFIHSEVFKLLDSIGFIEKETYYENNKNLKELTNNLNIINNY